MNLSNIKSFLNSDKGVSLVETLVALLVTSVTIIAIMSLAQKSYKAVTVSKIQESGNGIAEKALECITAYRGGNFTTAQADCKNFVGVNATTNIKTVEMNASGSNKVDFRVTMSCGTRATATDAQSLVVKVEAFETGTNTPFKTVGNKNLCISYATTILSSGAGGIYTDNCNSGEPNNLLCPN